MKPSIKKKANYSFHPHSLRGKVLKYLHCRQMLILVCSLVVLECLCVMAELMLDLQRIRVRFENEEKEIGEFVKIMRSKNPEAFDSFQGQTLEELLQLLQRSTSIWTEQEGHNMSCDCDPTFICSQEKAEPANRRTREVYNGNIYKTINIEPENDFKFSNQIDEDKTVHKFVDMSNVNSLTKLKHAAKPLFIRFINSKYFNMDYKNTYNKLLITTFKSNLGKLLTHFTKITDANGETPFKSDMHIKSGDLHSEASGNDVVQNSNTNLANNKKSVFDKDHIKNQRTAINNMQNKNSASKETTKNRLQSRAVHRRFKRHSGTIMEEANVTKIIVFNVINANTHFRIVSEFQDLENGESKDFTGDARGNVMHYENIHNISHVIKYCGFCILTLMLCETLVKFACLGFGFFKKKIEVFDAFIVIVSFALDVVFIDSKWYESGKDATTILVLLLPWRVVRIVNSFLMTINHKHYIEMMTVRRAKKKSDNKLKKLEHLMVEMRHDIDLLVSLCRTKDAKEPEIAACLYGKGRGSTTLAAITSFASLMFISTLGKKDPRKADEYTDVYGDLIREILNDDDDDTLTDKGVTDTSTTERDDTEESDNDYITPEQIYSIKRQVSGKHRNDCKNSQRWNNKRRSTLPRRHASCTDDDTTVSYVNDAYVTTDETKCDNTPNMYSKSTVKSMPTICSAAGNNFVTFEVTTQVTYL